MHSLISQDTGVDRSQPDRLNVAWSTVLDTIRRICGEDAAEQFATYPELRRSVLQHLFMAHDLAELDAEFVRRFVLTAEAYHIYQQLGTREDAVHVFWRRS